MIDKKTKQELQIENLTIAVQDLTSQVAELSYLLKGDGGHTIGDSLENIMFLMLKQQKQETPQ